MFKRTTCRFVIFTVLASLLASGLPFMPVAGPALLRAAPQPSDGVIVYQFHRRFRCDACYKLEEAINEGLRTHFPEELRTGKLVYRVVDLDAPGIEKFEKKYDFFYNTVIMVDVEKGREVRFKNLEEVWGLVEEKEAVISFIRKHIEEYL